MDQLQQQLESQYENASKRAKLCLITTKGGTDAEHQYSIAYQNLVKAGMRLQIKKKYR